MPRVLLSKAPSDVGLKFQASRKIHIETGEMNLKADKPQTIQTEGGRAKIVEIALSGVDDEENSYEEKPIKKLNKPAVLAYQDSCFPEQSEASTLKRTS